MVKKFCYIRLYRQKNPIRLGVTDHLYSGVVCFYSISEWLWGAQEEKNLNKSGSPKEENSDDGSGRNKLQVKARELWQFSQVICSSLNPEKQKSEWEDEMEHIRKEQLLQLLGAGEES